MNDPKDGIKQWEYEFKHYYVSEIENDMKCLGQVMVLHRIQVPMGGNR